jgi:hypothetical protein
MLYRHTQRGIATFAICLGILQGAIAWLTGLMWMVIMLIILVVAGITFHSLTIEVSEGELRWHFGPGFLSYRLALDEIRTVSIVRNRWWNGFGIRMAPGFRLYNAYGTNAVELRLKSGDIRRIGTDDPQGLAAALKSAIGA